MKIFKVIIVFLALNTAANAQVEMLDSISLATYQEYTDLEEALKNPDNVIKLSLRKKKYKEFSNLKICSISISVKIQLKNCPTVLFNSNFCNI